MRKKAFFVGMIFLFIVFIVYEAITLPRKKINTFKKASAGPKINFSLTSFYGLPLGKIEPGQTIAVQIRMTPNQTFSLNTAGIEIGFDENFIIPDSLNCSDLFTFKAPISQITTNTIKLTCLKMNTTSTDPVIIKPESSNILGSFSITAKDTAIGKTQLSFLRVNAPQKDGGANLAVMPDPIEISIEKPEPTLIPTSEPTITPIPSPSPTQTPTTEPPTPVPSIDVSCQPDGEKCSNGSNCCSNVCFKGMCQENRCIGGQCDEL